MVIDGKSIAMLIYLFSQSGWDVSIIFNLLRKLNESFHKCIVNSFLNKYSASCKTNFSLVCK